MKNKISIDIIRENISDIYSILIQANSTIIELVQNCNATKREEINAQLNKNSIINKTSLIDQDISTLMSDENTSKKDIKVLTSYLKISSELLGISHNTRTVINRFERGCEDLKNKDIKAMTSDMYLYMTKILQLSSDMINQPEEEEREDFYKEIVILEEKIDCIYEKIENKIADLGEKNKKLSKNEHILKALRRSQKVANGAFGIADILKPSSF